MCILIDMFPIRVLGFMQDCELQPEFAHDQTILESFLCHQTSVRVEVYAIGTFESAAATVLVSHRNLVPFAGKFSVGDV